MKLDIDDTIVAIASAGGGAGRGIVRISGPQCGECLDATLAQENETRVSCLPPGSIHGASMTIEPIGRQLPVTVYWWPDERSYTRQPSAELHVCGSPPLIHAVVDTLCRHNARLAEPGEFTLRAFLAGRLDLTQAEAVLGVIDATDRDHAEHALRQLAGGLAQPLHQLRDSLLDMLSHLEAGLDFVEEDIEFISEQELKEGTRSILDQVERILDQMKSRATAADAPSVVFCGPPNVGKSSLLNALAGQSLTLVADESGTTRDFVDQVVELEGMEIRLVDTAGLHDQDALGPLEYEAEQVTLDQCRTADVVIECFDGSIDPGGSRSVLPPQSAPERLRVATKIDLAANGSRPAIANIDVATSANTGEGISQLREAIRAKVAEQRESTGYAVDETVTRCRDSLIAAREAMVRAVEAITSRVSDEFIAVELRQALDDLGAVAGAVYTDDILDRVFGRFCIGK